MGIVMSGTGLGFSCSCGIGRKSEAFLPLFFFLVNCFSLLTFLGIPGGLVFFFFSLLEHTNCFFLFLREELSVFL
jgi:hypothetical protein